MCREPSPSRGVNDFIDDGDVAYSVILGPASSADASYHAFDADDVPVTNLDDADTASVTINQSGGTTAVNESGAMDFYTVALGTQPVSEVVIALSTNGEVTAAPATLHFTPDNWNLPQTVTVTAVDDRVDEGNPDPFVHTGEIAHAVSSGDPGYDGLAVAELTVQVGDNDLAGVTLSQTGGSTTVNESGGSDSYTVVLNTQPAAPVTVTLTPDNQVSASASQLTFTPTNWNVPQTVTVTAVDDLVDEGNPDPFLHAGQIQHALASNDPLYNNLAVPALVVDVGDNDVAGVTITPSDGLTGVNEGSGSDSYTVVLDTQPTADVTIALTPDSQVSASASQLTFTPANWSTPQTVTVTAVDDAIDEGEPGPVPARRPDSARHQQQRSALQQSGALGPRRRRGR